MKNNLQKISLISAFILLLALSASFWFLYREIGKNKEKAEIYAANLEREENRRAEIKALRSSLREIEDDRAQLETHFAKSSDIVPFLDTMEKLALKTGAKAEVESVNAGAGNKTLTVQIKASGTFSAVYKFLMLLENSPYELDFLLVDMNSARGEDKTSNWSAIFKMQLLTFLP